MSRPVISEIPTGPDVVTALAGGGTVTPVWRNELGGLIGSPHPAASSRMAGGGAGVRGNQIGGTGLVMFDMP